jgi:hypothetical protein
MSKFVKVFAALVLIAGAIMPGTALAQHHGGGHHGGGGHYGSGWHGGGWGPGFGYGYGWGYPYYYGGPSYSYGPGCGWTRVRVWRNGHWVLRRTWRCW